MSTFHRDGANLRPRKDASIARLPFRDSYSEAPPVLRTHLWYGDVDHVAGVSLDQFSTVTYRANGCFDPYYLPGGHSPRNFNRFASYYTNYADYHSDIECKFMNNTLFADDTAESEKTDMYVGITLLFPSIVFPASMAALLEDPFTRTGMLTKPGQQLTLRHNWDYKAFADAATYSDIVLDNEYTAVSNGLPASIKQYRYVIWSVPINSGGAYAHTVQTNISYNTLWWGLQSGYIDLDPAFAMSDVYEPVDDSILAGLTTTVYDPLEADDPMNTHWVLVP